MPEFYHSPLSKYLIVWVLLALSSTQCHYRDTSQHKVTGLGAPTDMANIRLNTTFDLQGHRGARGLMPENSLPAFIKAIELGVRTLELDVVVSKDNQIIISHEPFFSPEICHDAQGDTIQPKQEEKYNLYLFTAEEIQAYDCGSWGNPRFPEQKPQKTYKPTLQEMVSHVEAYLIEKKRPKVFYNIETKSSPEGDSIFHPAPEEFARLLYQEIKNLKILDRVFIQSFDVRTLRAFKRLNEEIPLVLLVGNNKSIEANIKELGFTPSVYSPEYKRLNVAEVKKAKELGMKVIPWTVNEPEDMRKMLRLGVDGLITDYPDRFNKLTKTKKTAP